MTEDKYLWIVEVMRQGYAEAEIVRASDGRAVDYRILEVNPAFERLVGVPAAEARGRTAREAVPGIEEWWIDTFDRVVRQGKPTQFEQEIASLGRWYEVYAYPLGNDRFMALYEEITERKEQTQRQEFLLKLHEALSPLTDAAAIQEAAARILGEHLRVAWTYYGEMNNPPTHMTVKRCYTRNVPSLVGVHQISSFDILAPLQVGETVVVPNMESSTMVSDGTRLRFGALGMNSFAGAPIVKEGVLDACLIVADTVARPWTDGERRLIEEAADRTWAAVQRAYSEDELRADGERQAFLLKLSDSLRPLGEPEQIQATVAQLVMDHFEADRCFYSEIENDTATIRWDASRGDLPSLSGVYPLSGLPLFKAASQSGQPIVVPDIHLTDLLDDELKELCIHLKMISFINVPVIKNGQFVGNLCITLSTPRSWTDSEVALAKETVERTWSAVERSRVEAALRKSEEQVREQLHFITTITETVPDIVSVFEYPSRKLRYINRTPLAEQGFEADELARMTLEQRQQLIHSDDHEALSNYYAAFATLPDRAVATVEYRSKNKAGKWLWFRAHGRVFERDSEGNTTAFVNIIQNITERKRYEQRQEFLLKLSDALRPYADAMEIQRAAMQLVGELLEVDRTLYSEIRDDGETIHIEENYVRGNVPKVTGDFPVQTFGAAMNILRRGKFLIIEDERTTPLKTPLEREASVNLGVLASATVPLIREGRWVASFGVLHGSPRQWTENEILILQETAEHTWAAVERARAEAALRESEDRYRTLFESIDEGFCTIEVLFDDKQTPVDYRFLTMNPAFVQQTGLENAVGKTVRELVPNHEEHWFTIYGDVALTGRPIRFEEEAAALNRWYDVYAFRLDPPQNNQVGVLFKDILPRKQMEDALHQANELLERRVAERTEQVSTLVTQLTMSEQEERRRISAFLHDDLQQRLFGIGFQLLTLRSMLAPEEDKVPEVQQQFWQIDQELSVAIRLTRDLSIDLSPPVLHNEGLVEALYWLASQMEQQHGLTVVVQTVESIPLINEDLRVLLFQMTRELLFNVVKHAGISTATITLSTENEHLRIQVDDKGEGFDPQAQPAPMSQGLVRLEQRLQLIGGSIQITSTQGRGTRISLDIPLPKNRE